MHMMQHRPILTTLDVCLNHLAELGLDDIQCREKIVKVIAGL